MVASVEKTAEAQPVLPPSPASLFMRRRSVRSRYVDNQEPALADLLTDPIVHRLLASDGVRSDHLIDLIADVKVRLARRDRIS
jgi:hypothetical protein